jgi:hypothetical protein
MHQNYKSRWVTKVKEKVPKKLKIETPSSLTIEQFKQGGGSWKGKGGMREDKDKEREECHLECEGGTQE